MIILTRIQEVDTSWGAWRLKYELLQLHFGYGETQGSYYGIRIRQYDKCETGTNPDEGTNQEKNLADDSGIMGVAEDLERVRYFFFQLVEGVAMPVHLGEMIDDWQAGM